MTATQTACHNVACTANPLNDNGNIHAQYFLDALLNKSYENDKNEIKIEFKDTQGLESICAADRSR